MKNIKLRGRIKKIDIKNSKKNEQSIVITLEKTSIDKKNIVALILTKGHELDLYFKVLRDSRLKIIIDKINLAIGKKKLAIGKIIRDRKRGFKKCLLNLLRRLRR